MIWTPSVQGGRIPEQARQYQLQRRKLVKIPRTACAGHYGRRPGGRYLSEQRVGYVPMEDPSTLQILLKAWYNRFWWPAPARK